MKNALTIDIEDYFHICGVEEYWPPSKWENIEHRVEENTYLVLELLESYGVRATFFILGYIAQKYPSLVHQISEAGHEIGCHSLYHRSILRQTMAEFKEDLSRSINILEDLLGSKVTSYRAPEWTITRKTLWAFDILREHGICYDSSTVPLTAMGDRSFPDIPYRLKTDRGDIMEFPATSMRCLWEHFPFTGGLPLRMSPYWYTEEAIKFCNRRSVPVIIYAHPWELDPNHPPMTLTRGRRFMHFFHIKSVRPKLEALLQEFEFSPMSEVLESYLGPDGVGKNRIYSFRADGDDPGIMPSK